MFEHILSLLFFAAATQGFLLAGVLAIHKRNIQANHILALWVALLSLDLLGQIFYAEDIYKQLPQLIGLTNCLPLSYAGFFFLYVRSFTTGQPIRWQDIFHFVGYFAGILLISPDLLSSPESKLELVARITADQEPWQYRLIDWFMPTYATIYAIACIVLLKRNQSAVNKARFKWLHGLLLINITIWLVVWLCTLVPYFHIPSNNQLVYFLVSLFIYLLGYASLRQPDLFSAPTNDLVSETKDSVPKYGDNRLPDDLREQILAALEQHMREQTPWRSSNLTLSQLAESTGLASHHISQVLNDHHGQSFNDYLNQYRVNALCHMLSEPHSQNLLDLALSCGFSSKSSFNAIFKKQTGKTPSEYRKSVQA
ncbi:hypothetical protein GCM10011613_34820 [Cellvibrio zantedeschiae]|uniref:HTH araC/xylS-type domain-containing protein n=1 Tax=Cellvibrio zantedeschiae TaxID=1237077 RepID=A0ABQ3BEC1_9GAMM|nr:helix-turn-helix domain-containing protein [Cellvibrio zantedeschiae]GGY86687.1 hypothetical protein GCM10011613_34820 [Cellvibrio zantedeschiae]